MTGATIASAMVAARLATASAQIVSVQMRPIGPCCSIDPIGKNAQTPCLIWASTSGHVIKLSCIGLKARGGSKSACPKCYKY